MTETLEDPFAAEVTRFQEAIEAAEEVTLEVGTGLGRPMLMTDSVNNFDEDNVYVAWNIDPRSHRHMNEKHIGPSRYAVYTALHDRDLIHELIPEEKVSRVLVANVFGEPETSASIQPRVSKFDSKIETLLHARELMRPGAELTIIETISPSYAGDFYDPDKARELLEGLGFKGIAYHKRHDKDFKAEYIKAGQADYLESDSFAITARKA